MASMHDLRGTFHGSFRIGGKTGPRIHQGASAPATNVGDVGDFYLRTEALPRVYQKVGSDWVQLASTQRVTQAKATDYQTQLPDEVILVTTTGNPVTITLGNTTTKNGKAIIIKDAGGAAGTNPITIVGQGGQLIDGSPEHVINHNRESVHLLSDGVNWHVI